MGTRTSFDLAWQQGADDYKQGLVEQNHYNDIDLILEYLNGYEFERSKDGVCVECEAKNCCGRCHCCD